MLLVNLASFLVLLSAVPSYRSVKNKAAEAELKGNLYNIQLSVERFAIDHGGSYPADFGEVLSAGYMDSLPRNPLFDGQTMQDIEFDANHEPGTFTYLRHKTGNGDHYYLILFGAKEQEKSLMGMQSGGGNSGGREDGDINGDGQDDGVILVLSNDPDFRQSLPGILGGGG